MIKRIWKNHVLQHDITIAWENQTSQKISHQTDQVLLGDVTKQNEITVALVHQQRLLSLPARDIPV